MNVNRFIVKLHLKLVQTFDGEGQITSWIIKNLPKFYGWLHYIHISIKDEELKAPQLLCDPNKTSIDIGAFYGAYTRKMLKYSKKVISIEANPESFGVLKAMFSNNSKTELLNKAVSNTLDEFTFNTPLGRPALSYINTEQTKITEIKATQYKVNAIPLDSLQLTNVGFVKMDIEGHELQALQGMTETLKKYHPTLLMEIEDRHSTNSTAIIDLLKDLGYKSYIYKKGKLEPVSIIGSNESASYNQIIDYNNNFVFKI